jgi:hypothetical protein
MQADHTTPTEFISVEAGLCTTASRNISGWNPSSLEEVMHWAPIPIAEFPLQPPADADTTDADIFRILSRAARRGFWITAFAMCIFLAIAVAGSIASMFVSIVFTVLALAAATGHLLIRHTLNLALWISREPAAVYWAEPRQINRQLFWFQVTVNSLALHTPAPVRLEPTLRQDELMAVLHWLRRRNPDALIGTYSPTDSDARLSGNDPWSPAKM